MCDPENRHKLKREEKEMCDTTCDDICDRPEGLHIDVEDFCDYLGCPDDFDFEMEFEENVCDPDDTKLSFHHIFRLGE